MNDIVIDWQKREFVSGHDPLPYPDMVMLVIELRKSSHYESTWLNRVEKLTYLNGNTRKVEPPCLFTFEFDTKKRRAYYQKFLQEIRNE